MEAGRCRWTTQELGLSFAPESRGEAGERRWGLVVLVVGDFGIPQKYGDEKPEDGGIAYFQTSSNM